MFTLLFKKTIIVSLALNSLATLTRAEIEPRYSAHHGSVSLTKICEDLKQQVSLTQWHPAIFLLGEIHGVKRVSDQQIEILEALKASGFIVQTALEFLEYPHQETVNQFRAGLISQPEFLQKISWGGFDFGLYVRQILFPDASSLSMAINSPRSLTRKIARTGLNSLTKEEKQLLPPNLERGNDGYFQRFREVMGSHLASPESLENYFMAQSVWDDTMAWQLISRSRESKDPNLSVIVVVVGEFHTAFGGGLIDRLVQRGWKGPIVSLSQLPAQGFRPDSDIYHPSFGIRSHYYWLH
jgi:uncharacterized iron-regulated protein